MEWLNKTEAAQRINRHRSFIDKLIKRKILRGKKLDSSRIYFSSDEIDRAFDSLESHISPKLKTLSDTNKKHNGKSLTLAELYEKEFNN